jgi:hypothetical protein
MKKFPSIVLTRAVSKLPGYAFSAFLQNDKVFNSAPVRVIDLPESISKDYAFALEPAMRAIPRLKPQPSIVQYECYEDFHCAFVVFDGKLLSFFKMLATGIFIANESQLDVTTWRLHIQANGELDDRKLDRDMHAGFLAWALTEIMRLSPDERMIHHNADHTIFNGRRVAIPAFDHFIAPEDPAEIAGYACRAISNKEEIDRMQHVFERTTLTPEAGMARSGYKITCCRCGRVEELVASGHTGSLPQTVINKKFQQKGWKTGRKAVGPCCLAPKPAKFIAEEAMKSAPTLPKVPTKTIDSVATQINSQSPVAIEPPREMTAADKRKVFRAIDDQWDEGKGRYIGAASDQHIADTLGVPRAWVREVREENFGKSQRNEDIDKLIGDAKNLRAEAARNAATALDLATKFEQLDVKYQEMIRRLEAVE